MIRIRVYLFVRVDENSLSLLQNVRYSLVVNFFDESCFFFMFLEFSDAKAAIENILSRISFDPKYCTRLLHWLRNLDMKSFGKQEKTKKPGSHFTAKLPLMVFLKELNIKYFRNAMNTIVCRVLYRLCILNMHPQSRSNFCCLYM